MKKLAKRDSKKYRLSSPSEESKGIDGYIGTDPISIKPTTYKVKHLPEQISVRIIYYEKKKEGLVITL